MRIYVGNLSEQTTKREIRETFAEYGEVSRVAIRSKSRDGLSRVYGLVEMLRNEEGELAIAKLHGSIFGERVLKVKEAPSRTGRSGARRDNASSS